MRGARSCTLRMSLVYETNGNNSIYSLYVTQAYLHVGAAQQPLTPSQERRSVYSWDGQLPRLSSSLADLRLLSKKTCIFVYMFVYLLSYI